MRPQTTLHNLFLSTWVLFSLFSTDFSHRRGLNSSSASHQITKKKKTTHSFVRFQFKAGHSYKILYYFFFWFRVESNRACGTSNNYMMCCISQLYLYLAALYLFCFMYAVCFSIQTIFFLFFFLLFSLWNCCFYTMDISIC